MAVDLATLRDRLDLPAAVISDEELQEVLDACTENQNAEVERPELVSAALDRALVRRCAREVAAKGMPLGAQAGEFGTFYIPGFSDPILAGLEKDYRKPGFA